MDSGANGSVIKGLGAIVLLSCLILWSYFYLRNPK